MILGDGAQTLTERAQNPTASKNARLLAEAAVTFIYRGDHFCSPCKIQNPTAS